MPEEKKKHKIALGVVGTTALGMVSYLGIFGNRDDLPLPIAITLQEGGIPTRRVLGVPVRASHPSNLGNMSTDVERIETPAAPSQGSLFAPFAVSIQETVSIVISYDDFKQMFFFDGHEQHPDLIKLGNSYYRINELQHVDVSVFFPMRALNGEYLKQTYPWDVIKNGRRNEEAIGEITNCIGAHTEAVGSLMINSVLARDGRPSRFVAHVPQEEKPNNVYYPHEPIMTIEDSKVGMRAAFEEQAHRIMAVVEGKYRTTTLSELGKDPGSFRMRDPRPITMQQFCDLMDRLAQSRKGDSFLRQR